MVDGKIIQRGLQQRVSSDPAPRVEPGQMNIRIPSDTKKWPEMRIENATSFKYPKDLNFGLLEITGDMRDLELDELHADEVTWYTENGSLEIKDLHSRDASIVTGMGSLKVGRWTGDIAAFQTQDKANVRLLT